MNRLTTALLAALEAVIMVAIGIGVLLAPLTLMWAIGYGMSVDWMVFWRASVDVWLLGHGVNLLVTLPAETVAALGFPAAGVPFQITLAALGFALFTSLMAWRIGARAARAESPLLAIGAAAGTMIVLSTVLALSAQNPLVQSSMWQAVLFPAAFLAAGALAGAYSTDNTALGSLPGFERLSERMRLLAAQALRGGAAAAAAVVAVSALVVAALIATNYGTIIGLYETMQAGALGGLALTLAQLAFLPVFVLWGVSWLIGPGFAIGTGTSVSPALTQLGALPGIPLFGALPQGESPLGFAVVIVPVLIGVGVGILTRRNWKGEGGPRELAILAATIGVVSGVLLGFLAWLAVGSIGPGRFWDAGPNPWLVGVFAALEIAVGAAVGLFALRPGRIRSPE